MPYNSNSQLPDSVKNVLPKHAQDIYREAFNSAHDEYKSPAKRKGSSDREETAHRVAWNAVKSKYEKGGDGKWRAK